MRLRAQSVYRYARERYLALQRNPRVRKKTATNIGTTTGLRESTFRAILGTSPSMVTTAFVLHGGKRVGEKIHCRLLSPQVRLR